MKNIAFLLALAFGISCNSRSQIKAGNQQINKDSPAIVGGGCEGCEAIYESPVPFDELNPVATISDFNETGPKIEISGTIYQADGKTPAPNVVLYVYHTNQQGKYPSTGTETNWGKRHGYLRVWVKTDPNGFYKFYTLVPASYPNSSNPKHIHPVVKEPGINEYYIDEYLFDNDPLLSQKERKKTEPRGGSGILEPVVKDGMLRTTRNIILGLNIPDYPALKQTALQSGLSIGDGCPAFEPLHLSGADEGKTTCPMCKYG